MAKSTDDEKNNSHVCISGNDVAMGARIREERLHLGLSQEAFARKLGVHRRSQGHYESGDSAPDAMYLKTALAVGVDVNYILTGERGDYWNRSLIRIIDLILDELGLASRDDEFKMIRQLGYDDILAFVRGGASDQADKALKQAVHQFLRQSPSFLNDRVLSELIERVEFVCEARAIAPSPSEKADAILSLYRQRQSSDTPPDLQSVAAALGV